MNDLRPPKATRYTGHGKKEEPWKNQSKPTTGVGGFLGRGEKIKKS